MKIYLRLYISLCFIFFVSVVSKSQEIIWSRRLMDYTKKFHGDNNSVEMAIGVPSIYPDSNLNNPVNKYSEGYVLYNKKTRKKNVIKMGFNDPVLAQQVILGGIYNPGAIHSINLILADGHSRKNVFTFHEGYSLVKFHDFHVFFEPLSVLAVEVEFNHNHINGWNLMRGIGLANYNKPIDVVPYQVNLDPKFVRKEFIDENLKSSDCILFSPEISPDGKTLYFVKECNTQEGQDIWYSTLTDCGWTKPKNIGFPLNNNSHNYVASVGLGGKSLLLGNRYNIDGTYAGDGVSMTHKISEDRWSIPEPINIPNHINYNENSNYFLSKDEKHLIFASEDDNSLGELDLYVSHFSNETKTWSEPMHLGGTVNTPFSEDYPYLAEDGVTMYFSSNGHIGYGAHDVYMTKRLDETWKSWSQPVNLGTSINTCFDDKGFTVSSDGKHAYLNSTSHRQSAIIDIFRINLPVEFYQIGDHNSSKISSLKTPMRIDVR